MTQSAVISANESSIVITCEAELASVIVERLLNNQNRQGAFFEHFQGVTADKELAQTRTSKRAHNQHVDIMGLLVSEPLFEKVTF